MPVIRKNFYMMRHGQSADNLAGMISGGGSDPELTPEGISQAKQAAILYIALQEKPVIITSGLKRASQTARLLDEVVELIEDSDLNERHLGELDGKITEIEQKRLGVLPGEEPTAIHAARVAASLNRHLEKEGTALFICHAGTIRRVLEMLDLKGQVEVENARLYRFSYDERSWFVKEILD